MTTSTRPEQRFASGTSAGSTTRGSSGKVVDGREQPAAGKPKATFLRSKKGLLSLVALLGVGGGTYKALAPAAPSGPPTGGEYVALDSTTLNLQGGHYLKVAVAIQLVKGKASAASFQTYQAAALTISEFSNRAVPELSTQAGRSRLTADLLAKVQAAYPGEVYQVYLTQFVTQ